MANRGGTNWRGWAVLFAASAIVTPLFYLLRVPAALLLGPLTAGIVVASRVSRLTIHRNLVTASQAVVGCLIAGGVAGALGPVVREHWLLFSALTVATIGASGGLGYLLSRLGVVPGSVAIWGSMPGGAAAMVLMAEAQGADPRLVAVMVYSRVVTVTLAATVLAALLVESRPAPLATSAVLAAPWWALVAVASAGAGLAAVFRWPAGTLILTMALGVASELAGMAPLRVPPVMMTLALATIGWRIGLSFTGEARGAAFRMLPRILLAALLLTGFCGLLAAALHLTLGIDLLTAWLATSPGGLESVAVIASALPVDVPFIMAAQTARFGAVMLIGPALATTLARRSRRNDRTETS